VSIKAYESPDKRLRTEFYSLNGEKRFSLAEKTKIGILLTEFNSEGEVLRQEYRKSEKEEEELSSFIGSKIEVEKVDEYTPVEVSAKCSKCGGEIARELDFENLGEVEDVPVVPIYFCKSCKTKYYSLPDSFLSSIVHARPDLFEPDEIEEMKADEKAFIDKLQQIVIRIFASKKIFRLQVEKKVQK